MDIISHPEATQTGVKTCSRCGIEKPANGFSRTERGLLKRHSVCKTCHSAANRIWVRNNPERARELYSRAYYKNHAAKKEARRKWKELFPEKEMLGQARLRAKRSGLPFSIESSDIIIPDICPILGIKIFRVSSLVNTGPRPHSPSLDRIVPRLGYVKGNVRVISHKANTIKNNATPEELMKVASFMAKDGC